MKTRDELISRIYQSVSDPQDVWVEVLDEVINFTEWLEPAMGHSDRNHWTFGSSLHWRWRRVNGHAR